MSRCLYNSSFEEFISADENLIFGVIDGGAHGVTLTTAKEAWKAEISIMKLVQWQQAQPWDKRENSLKDKTFKEYITNGHIR